MHLSHIKFERPKNLGLLEHVHSIFHDVRMNNVNLIREIINYKFLDSFESIFIINCEN